MLHQRMIRTWVAFSMMLLLLMGILPKPVVHECLTGHEHAVASQSGQKEFSTGKTVLTCNCNEVVFVSPFDLPAEVVVEPIAAVYTTHSSELFSVFINAVTDNTALRGPPTRL